MTPTQDTNPTAGPHSILVTGASSGIGALTVRRLARAGHTVYAGIRAVATRNAAAVADLEHFSQLHHVDARALELDVTSDTSVQTAIAQILSDPAGLDVIVHNAGHLMTGPLEAFSPDDLAEMYAVDVLGAQRVNRQVLPHLRSQASGLLIWIGSSSTRGGYPPFLGPYVAAKAAGDALAVSYASELIRFGIETSIIIPGRFEQGTNHFRNAESPADEARTRAYAPLQRDVREHLAGLVPPDADIGEVAEAIADVVDLPFGARPFRVHVDPVRGGSEIVSTVADRIRAEYFHRIGLSDLLTAGASR
jgi:NAD(P)-dependent dehydrogenase (short-subunit alcohol dehydrogenase family)